MKRPLFQVAALYAAGILLADSQFLFNTFAVAFVLLASSFCWAAWRPWLLCLLFVLAGWINFTQRTIVLSRTMCARSLVKILIVSVRGRLRDTPQHHIHQRTRKGIENSTALLELSAISFDQQNWKR